eukprot:TRINITY_DN2076_c0_g1_i1.p2 TRINITY_DN2076_c0_g1~~TRINITY_DN2076_c0_g1_i1.p2  ORF type:complete len:408 (-),score=146.34 TRINITY_DN2076_c0_g1_i1:1733-2926(-)
MNKYIALLLALVLLASATTHFSETFSEGWEDRWIVSTNKQEEGTAGKFILGASLLGEEQGLKTSEDARFYSISAAFDEFSNEGQDLVFQFSISHSQSIDCGGGYIKLLPPGFDQENFNGETPYHIMFGPDICGATKRTHVILSKGGENHLVNKEVRCESDVFTHVYTLVIHPDNTYDVKIDGEVKQTGTIEDDWDILPPKTIPDPNESKPSDWVDEKMIPDPEDVKPADWDDEPMEIADPEAVKPEDWDDDLDGDWVAPTIPNPEYKGEWRPRMIENPEYKGEWVHPEIDNPEYKPDPTLYQYTFGGVGIEIWQVKAGTVFDNILVTDSVEEAEAAATAILAVQASEKEVKKAQDEAEAEQRRIEAEAAEAAAAAAEAEAAETVDEPVAEPEVKEDL